MSRNNKGVKAPGTDYGSRRPFKSATSGGGYPNPGPCTKRGTHRAERRPAARNSECLQRLAYETSPLDHLRRRRPPRTGPRNQDAARRGDLPQGVTEGAVEAGEEFMNYGKSTDNMTAKELMEELDQLEKLAASEALTPIDANRMREVKSALRNIRDAQKRW